MHRQYICGQLATLSGRIFITYMISYMFSYMFSCTFSCTFSCRRRPRKARMRLGGIKNRPSVKSVESVRCSPCAYTRRQSQSSSSPNSQSAETPHSLQMRTTAPRSGKLLLRSHNDTVSCDTESNSPILLWVQPRSMRSDFNFSPKFSIS